MKVWYRLIYIISRKRQLETSKIRRRCKRRPFWKMSRKLEHGDLIYEFGQLVDAEMPVYILRFLEGSTLQYLFSWGINVTTYSI